MRLTACYALLLFSPFGKALREVVDQNIEASSDGEQFGKSVHSGQLEQQTSACTSSEDFATFVAWLQDQCPNINAGNGLGMNLIRIMTSAEDYVTIRDLSDVVCLALNAVALWADNEKESNSATWTAYQNINNGLAAVDAWLTKVWELAPPSKWNTRRANRLLQGIVNALDTYSLAYSEHQVFEHASLLAGGFSIYCGAGGDTDEKKRSLGKLLTTLMDALNSARNELDGWPVLNLIMAQQSGYVQWKNMMQNPPGEENDLRTPDINKVTALLSQVRDDLSNMNNIDQECINAVQAL